MHTRIKESNHRHGLSSQGAAVCMYTGAGGSGNIMLGRNSVPCAGYVGPTQVDEHLVEALKREACTRGIFFQVRFAPFPDSCTR